ncbi:hypothetical protein SLS63_012023 [Diaporthe eres]|uniref:BTB domain-containing protein n=1 Tax=Diaporthe eres TaxID=83184 RepID=A0ABR1NSK6_DIAER
MSHLEGEGSLANSDIRLLESGDLADATIVCGDRTWKVHKLILSSRNKWFKKAFFGDFAELQEAASSKIEFQEQDPDLIDAMLRFIYSTGKNQENKTFVSESGSETLTFKTDIDIPKLQDGIDTPALCVRIFRLGDFFLINDLKTKATTELNAHLYENLFFFFDFKPSDGQTPKWLTEIVHGLDEAYKDRSTESMSEILIEFVYIIKEHLFRHAEAVALLDKIPEMGRDLMKIYVTTELVKPSRAHGYWPGIPVYAAVRYPTHAYEPSNATLGAAGSTQAPCLLQRRYGLDCDKFPFEATHPATNAALRELLWITPQSSRIDQLAGDPESNIVRARVKVKHGNYEVLIVRFHGPEDARRFFEGYIKAWPGIKQKVRSNADLTEEIRKNIAKVAAQRIS